MTFPRSVNSPFTAVSCKVSNENARKALLARIGRVKRAFALPDKIPVQAASVLYLGLCRLKVANESADENDLIAVRDMLVTASELYILEQGGKGINCSYFEEWEHSDRRYPKHRHLIDAAMSTLVPDIRSFKKRCFLLLDLGSKHDASVPIPADESWMAGYDFRDVSFDM